MIVQENKKIIERYIDQIWNHRRFELLDDFIHDEYRDFSLPAALSPDITGLKTWINLTGSSFLHYTTIEDIVSEGDKTMIRIRMDLTHIGKWRDIEPTGHSISTQGFRAFLLKQGRILEHYAQINGESIAAQLRKAQEVGLKIEQH